MLDWQSAWVKDILEKADHAMNISELYEAVGVSFGIAAIAKVLTELEESNIIVPETDTTWRIK